MADHLPVKAAQAVDSAAILSEFENTDTLLVPGGGLKFSDGSVQTTSPAMMVASLTAQLEALKARVEVLESK